MEHDALRRGGSSEPTRGARRSRRKWLVSSAFAYPLALAATFALFLLVGERHWLTAALLYVPRIAFGAPLLVLVPALWLTRRRLLWTQVVAFALLLFPLMGFVLPGPRPRAHGQTLRVLSHNVDTGRLREDLLLREVDTLRPDIVLFQESWSPTLCTNPRRRFAHVECISEFVIASRFAILERTTPEPVEHLGARRTARFLRYLLESNLGKLAVYSMHPVSPRGAVRLPKSRAGELLSAARIWTGRGELLKNASLREKQAGAVAALCKREQAPVLIAGDTNLPGSSAALRRYFSDFRDGFSRAGWGFGYTFPAQHPFLRLDRMLVGPELDFAEFQVGCPDASDHLCVVADVFRR